MIGHYAIAGLTQTKKEIVVPGIDILFHYPELALDPGARSDREMPSHCSQEFIGVVLPFLFCNLGPEGRPKALPRAQLPNLPDSLQPPRCYDQS